MNQGFYIWDGVASDNPDWERLAVFCDWCEEKGFAESAPLRWLLENKRWPYAYHGGEASSNGTYDWLQSDSNTEAYSSAIPAHLIARLCEYAELPTVKAALWYFIEAWFRAERAEKRNSESHLTPQAGAV